MMFRDTFHEKSLFHFKPSQVTFERILCSLLGCLQARHSFIFPKKHDLAKKRCLAETQDMCLVESQDICLVETQDMCCAARACALFKANTTLLSPLYLRKEMGSWQAHRCAQNVDADLVGWV